MYSRNEMVTVYSFNTAKVVLSSPAGRDRNRNLMASAMIPTHPPETAQKVLWCLYWLTSFITINFHGLQPLISVECTKVHEMHSNKTYLSLKCHETTVSVATKYVCYYIDKCSWNGQNHIVFYWPHDVHQCKSVSSPLPPNPIPPTF